MFVEALMSDGNSASYFSTEISCVVCQASQVKIGVDQIHLVEVILSKGCNTAWRLRSKELFAKCLCFGSSRLEEDFRLAFAEVRSHCVRPQCVQDTTRSKAQILMELFIGVRSQWNC